jgi:hypothetical protein
MRVRGRGPSAGRPKDSRDRDPPAEGDALARLARQHAEAALNNLAEIATTGESEMACVAAAKALLDCAYGKRPRAHELGRSNEHLGVFKDQQAVTVGISAHLDEKDRREVG